MKIEPQKEHQWLQKLVGDWTFEAETIMDPDKPPAKSEGAETVRSLGGLWIVAEGQGEMPGGGHAVTILTLGYDPEKKHYVGAWIGSMMPHHWVYEGTLDAAGRALTLETEGPSMTGDGKTARYRDVIEFESDEHRLLHSYALDDDGAWRKIVTATYRRKS